MPDMSRRRILTQGVAGLTSVAALTGMPSSAHADPRPAALSTDLSQVGVAPVDSFAGDNDDEKFAAALAYAKAQTYKPTIVFSNRAYSFTRTFPMDFRGLRISGPLGGLAREFGTTNQVSCPTGGLFSVVAGTTVDAAISGLSFFGKGRFIADTPLDASGPILTDTTISDCGFSGFATIFTGTVLRASIQRIYANNLTGSGFVLGGSDCWLFTDGPNYMSGNLPATTPYVDLVNLSQSDVGRLYVTPQGGYALRIRDSFGGLNVRRFMSDGTGRTGALATQNQGLLITGGHGVKIEDFWCFNVNASGSAQGEIVVTGGEGLVFDSPVFPRSHGPFTAVNTSSPCIYTTVPIVVSNPQAPTGHPKLLRQSTAGLITLTGAPGWTITTAP
ncbi:MAG TPA: hypothetical protein VHX59_04385 [Mycobacteriales bacterium]|nr:hypothetical protein [Mycobacteriales bacterium]